MATIIEVPSMPLYWRFKDSPGSHPSDPPSRMPFGFDYDETLGLIIEKRSPQLSHVLADIYSRNANVGFLQDGHSLVRSYGEDFWRFLESVLDRHAVRTVLEIGCGGCVLLERLKNLGLEVVGIDPSPIAAEAGQEKGIRVIREFFPSSNLPFVPDLIFQVDVLEHIENPVVFLRAQAEFLAPGGLVVVNVPDCMPSIQSGDISMALHQHVNMFDRASLTATVQAAGLNVESLNRSSYGSALYCAGQKRERPTDVVTFPNRKNHKQFVDRVRRSIDNVCASIREARESGESVGFFMPQRAFPYLAFVDWFEGFRIFDNMNVWHRRYLDGIAIPIENQGDLVADPVDHVFVMSLTFGAEVQSAITRDVPKMKITTLEKMIR